MNISGDDLAASIDEIAARWRADRTQRQQRRHLDLADFDELREAGLLMIAVPEDQGGLWRSLTESVRSTCEPYRALAAADPSVALVSSMHPAVLVFWLVPEDSSRPDWEEQRRAVFEGASAGDQWGTITSEPGSGGDVSMTKAVATPIDTSPFIAGESFAVSGTKHFASGSGVTRYMVTTAVATGEAEPDVFVLDYGDRPWDGSAGLELIAEWDGMGMAATQSHSMRLVETPAVRHAHDGSADALMAAAAPLVGCLFTSVILGVLDEAVAEARRRISPRSGGLRPYEQVEWTRAERDHWLAVQAYEGALRAVESGDYETGRNAALRAKNAVAEIAESTMLRLARVLGGGTYSRSSPYSHWFEDVRALGFLRPPWGLAHDGLFTTSLES